MNWNRRSKYYWDLGGYANCKAGDLFIRHRDRDSGIQQKKRTRTYKKAQDLNLREREREREKWNYRIERERERESEIDGKLWLWMRMQREREREREIDNGRSNQRDATLSRAMTWSGYLAVVWMLFLFLTDHCGLFSLFFTIFDDL